MRLIRFSFLVVIAVLGSMNFADASPVIATSSASADLDTLTFYTTGDLSIEFIDPLGGGVLSSTTEIRLDDIYPSEYGAYYESPYFKDKDTIEFEFTAHGSGYLDVSVLAQLDYSGVSWAIPDKWGGEDGIIWIQINNIDQETKDFAFKWIGLGFPSGPIDFYWSGILSTNGNYGYPNNVLFNEGEVGTIFISTETYLHVQYDEYPQTPIPIPGAVWMLGSGIAGVIAIRKRRR